MKFDFLSWFLALLAIAIGIMLLVDSQAAGFSWLTEGRALLWAMILAVAGLIANVLYDNRKAVRATIKSKENRPS